MDHHWPTVIKLRSASSSCQWPARNGLKKFSWPPCRLRFYIQDRFIDQVIIFVRDLPMTSEALRWKEGTGLIRQSGCSPWPQFGWNHMVILVTSRHKIFQWSSWWALDQKLSQLDQVHHCKILAANRAMLFSVRISDTLTDKTLLLIACWASSSSAAPAFTKSILRWQRSCIRLTFDFADFKKRGYCAWCLLGYRHHWSVLWLTESSRSMESRSFLGRGNSQRNAELSSYHQCQLCLRPLHQKRSHPKLADQGVIWSIRRAKRASFITSSVSMELAVNAISP